MAIRLSTQVHKGCGTDSKWCNQYDVRFKLCEPNAIPNRLYNVSHSVEQDLLVDNKLIGG